MTQPQYHPLTPVISIAYHQHTGTRTGIMFLGGFKSDMQGSKAQFLQNYCQSFDHSYLRFDYRGHGQSGGTFTDYTITDWIDDALLMLDTYTGGKQILIGSSMGGWVMLKLASLRPNRIAGLIGIASAPDFTQRLMYEQFTPHQRDTLSHDGRLTLPSEYDEDYIITENLIDSGKAASFFHAPPPDITAPVTLLHGMNDADVPWHFSTDVAQHLPQDNVHVHLIKDGDHRLSRPADLAILQQTIRHMQDSINV